MALQSTRVVLDTNVVLDCFVFLDAMTRDLTTAIESGHTQPLVHQLALDELERVLAYPQCQLSTDEQKQVMNRYMTAATFVTMPDGFGRDALLLPPGFPRCRDRDDEPFLALAHHARADALVTKDKALLKLRRKARKFGVNIVGPRDL